MESSLRPSIMAITPTGFPSPADNYIDIGIDLNKQLIQNPASTFFLRVSGNLMRNAGINNGDLLIVDRSLDPIPGSIVIAIIDSTFNIRRLIHQNKSLYLETNYPKYKLTELCQYDDIHIWGVVIYSIHNIKTTQTRK